MAKESKRTIRALIEAKQVNRYAHEPVFRKCFDCGGQMHGRHTNYRYAECGLDNVLLIDVLVYTCECGAIVPEVPSLAGLHRLIVAEVLKKPAILQGDEVRFLRTYVGYTATYLADLIGTTNVTISRWENGAKIPKDSDRLLRLAAFASIVDQEVKAIFGTDTSTQTAELLEFARNVKDFDLPTFLRTIRDVQETHMIRINPAVLAGLGSPERLPGPSEYSPVH